MSSKAYLNASKYLDDNSRVAITNLYMAGINHDGHSWNTFGDVEDCLGVVVPNTRNQALDDFLKWMARNVKEEDVYMVHALNRYIEKFKEDTQNETGK